MTNNSRTCNLCQKSDLVTLQSLSSKEIGRAYRATQKPHNTGKMLPTINTYANFIASLILHYCKDYWGDIEIVEEQINDSHLFFLRPDSTWPFVSVRATGA